MDVFSIPTEIGCKFQPCLVAKLLFLSQSSFCLGTPMLVKAVLALPAKNQMIVVNDTIFHARKVTTSI